MSTDDPSLWAVCLCGHRAHEHRLQAPGRCGKATECGCDRYEPADAPAPQPSDPAPAPAPAAVIRPKLRAAVPAHREPTVPAASTSPAVGTVLRTYDAYACVVCGSRYFLPLTTHECGELVPVTVTVTVTVRASQ